MQSEDLQTIEWEFQLDAWHHMAAHFHHSVDHYRATRCKSDELGASLMRFACGVCPGVQGGQKIISTFVFSSCIMSFCQQHSALFKYKLFHELA